MSIGIVASSYPQVAATAVYADEVLADSPLGYWRLSDAATSDLDAMADDSGNGRNGRYRGSPIPSDTTSLLSGGVDSARDFTAGAGECAEVLDAAWMDVSSVTAEILVNADATTSKVLLARWDFGTGSNQHWMLDTNSGAFRFVVRVSGTTYTVTGSTSFSTGTTYHVAGTYDSSSGALKVYVNGVEDGSATVSGGGALNTGAARLGIGAAVTAGGAKSLEFDGVLDEPAFYNAALSGARIAAHSGAS